MSYTLDWQEKGISITFSGTVTGEEIIQSCYEIFGVPEFDDMSYQLVNTLAVEGFQVSKREMKKIAALDKAAAKSNFRVFIAIVANKKMIRELSQFYADENEDSTWETQIFEEIGEAKSWIEKQIE